MMHTLYFPLFFISSCVALLGIGREQSVAVSGVLTCNGLPASAIRVKLYEKEMTLDRKLDESYTNNSGTFFVQGTKREVSMIDPKINIYHRCNYFGPCYKKLSINIPKNYISDGPTPKMTYSVGVINLNNRFSGETVDCLN